MAHWETVHYVQRPAKNFERKMIIDVLGRLNQLRRLDAFQYVGFGSIYFVDFALFHRRLGIRRMTSIEKEDSAESQARVNFNRPFKFVKTRFGHSNDLLPQHDWSVPAIVWLDYNARLGDEVFADMETVLAQATPPFVLIVTANVEPGGVTARLAQFTQAVGVNRLPPGYNSDHDLRDWGTGRAARQIIDDEIARGVVVRNALAAPESQLAYHQLFHFRYRDRARMLTVGGVVSFSNDNQRLEACDFFGSPYAAGDEVAYEIVVPNLTIREMLHIDQRLSRTGVPNFAGKGISPEDAEEYRRAYKYFPAFVDIESL